MWQVVGWENVTGKVWGVRVVRVEGLEVYMACGGVRMKE